MPLMLTVSASAAVSSVPFISAAWGIPFVGILLSIALMPLVAPRFWHRHVGKVAGFWALAFMLPFAAVHGVRSAMAGIAHTLIIEYIPFILLITALYTVAGGICIHSHLRATPRINTALLALGTALASIMGTTGAAMLLIRPLLRANHTRQQRTHVVIFFIFLVANIGGALTPLGDPPLFLGFLNGVGFFWTTVHLLGPMCFVVALLLVLFYALDSYYFHRHEKGQTKQTKQIKQTLGSPKFSQGLFIAGKLNFVLLGIVLASVLLSGLLQSSSALHAFNLPTLNVPIAWQNLLRDSLMIAVTFVSLRFTPTSARAGNGFNWAPLAEVAKLFATIFVTIAPVIELLHASSSHPSHPHALGFITRAVNDAHGHAFNAMYFWVTGLLSSFLDNAPTYLVFFNIAGGDAAHLMHRGATTLTAISAGAVFMGANTYLGNAPNLMVKMIATAHGVKMPSFLGYMIWSGGILLPIFALTTLLFFNQ